MTTRDTSENENQERRRSRTTVPVVSRERDRKQAKKPAQRTPIVQRDLKSWAIFIVVLLAFMITIAVPLRNYYEGRSEIARLNDSIAALEEQKANLEENIDKYNDPEYVRQEARRRLGVMEPGETAWRIMDPRMTSSESITSDQAPDQRSWGQVLWDSLREVPEPDPAAAVQE